MSLPWVRLDTSVGDNPKMMALADDKRHRAMLGYILALCYVGRHELDGFIPNGALRVLYMTPSDAAALVDVGLWHTGDGGWLINDWADFQVSSEEAQRRREKAQKAALKRWRGEP